MIHEIARAADGLVFLTCANLPIGIDRILALVRMFGDAKNTVSGLIGRAIRQFGSSSGMPQE